MKLSQKLALRASEIRTRLAELAGKDDLTEEESAEVGTLRNEMRDVETRTQAAITAEDEPDPTETRTEDAEMAALVEGASIGEVFGAAMEHRTTDGQTSELQSELGLQANQVPLALLRDPEVELRAVTPAPGNVGQTQAEIIPGVFPQAAAAFLGVDMPTVGVGEAVFPVLTTNATVHVPAENAAAAETTGSFSADVLSPARLQAQFFYSREDRARFRGMDAALRQNLSDALADALDKQVIAGTDGLLTGTNLANHNVNAVTSYALYRSQFAYGRVDGTYATGAGDLRIVMGSATYAHAAGQYRGNNDNTDALMAMERATAGVRVSAHVPAVAGNKQNAVIRRGMRRDMVAPIWEGVTLIPDEVTKASNGQIVVTAVMLHAVKILRAAGFYKQQTQHA